MNRIWSPMLLSETKKPFNSKDFLFEVKFDGIRCFAYLEKNETILVNKRFKDVSKTYPELSKLHLQAKQPCLLDGELVFIDETNKPNFNELQARSIVTNPFKINQLSAEKPVKFIAYDILIVNKKELIEKPLIERKDILQNNIKQNEWIETSNYVIEHGIELFELVKKENLEGIVAKKLDSKYYPSSRTKNWIKIKFLKEQDFFAVALILNGNTIKYVLLAEKQNGKWKSRGKVYCPNPKDKEHFLNFLKKHKGKKLFDVEYDVVLWIEPKLKVSVSFMMLTKNGHMRAPVYRGIVKTKQ